MMMTMAQGGKLLLSAGDGFDGVVLMLLPLSSGNDYKRFFFFKHTYQNKIKKDLKKRVLEREIKV